MDPRVVSSSSKKEKHCKGQGIDIISNLPDYVLSRILSFVSTVDVIRMSVLSKRWQYLWTSISNIDLEEKNLYGRACIQSLEFVDRVLTLHDDTDIKKLRLQFFVPVKFPRLNKWICVAINHNVEELDLQLGPEKQNALPCWLFTCRSLVVLKIRAWLTFEAPPCTSFSNLKNLSLCGVTFSGNYSTQRLFTSCPVLDELALKYCKWEHIDSVTISIATLKSLTIEHCDRNRVVPGCMIKISSINLTSFNCSSDLKIHICTDVFPYLDGATVRISESPLSSDYHYWAPSLFSEIYNVKVLTISYDTLMYIIDGLGILHQIPRFYKLTHLKVDGLEQCPDNWELIVFLRKTPKLEHLDISESYMDDFAEADEMLEMVPSCFNSCFKMLSLSYFQGQPLEMEFLKFVLRNATVLQCMKLCYGGELSKDTTRLNVVRNQLNTFPKVSKSCVIELREKS